MVRKVIAVLGAFMLLGTQSRATEQELAIGAKANAGVRRHSRHRICMTHSAQLDPCVEDIIRGITYEIAYRESTGEISYISTTDTKFRNGHALRVGSTVDLTRDQVQAFPGWELRGPKGSDGWQPLFGIGTFGIVVVRDGKDIEVKDERNDKLLDKVFAESQTATFRIIGFVQSK